MNNVQILFANALSIPLIYNKWLNLNCQSCVRNGQPSNDTRHRGAFRFGNNGEISYHCFNCGIKGFYQPGFNGTNLIPIARDLHVDNSEIINILAEIDKLKDTAIQPAIEIKFVPKDLPSGSRLVSDIVLDTTHDVNFLKVINAIDKRNPYLFDVIDLYWCNSPENDLRNRFIVPFIMNDKIIGYTARSINNTGLRYYNQYPTNTLYNYDLLFDKSVQVVYVTEGPIDASLINGCAICNFQFKQEQINLLKSSAKKIVVVPDRDKDGKQMALQAVQNGFSVAFPEYGDVIVNNERKRIKDVDEATQHYGRLFVGYLIAKSTYDDEFSIKVKINQWF